MSVKKSKEIKLSNLLKEKFIALDLKGGDKKKVLGELTELIAQSKKIKSKKVFFNCLMEREELGSTGIGSGVAIPHAKTKAVNDFILAFARKDEGMDFGALDGEKTYVFFVLASPKEQVGGHLKILAEISRLVRDKFIVDLLRRAENKKEIIKVISEAEKIPR